MNYFFHLLLSNQTEGLLISNTSLKNRWIVLNLGDRHSRKKGIVINIPSWGVFRCVDIRDGFSVPNVLKNVEKSQNSVGILSSAQSPLQK